MKHSLNSQVTVIGAGLIGCSIAQVLSKQGYPVLVLEKGPRIAEGISSRNSGVIHAGIYYPPESLKAQSCIRGKALLYEWCEKYHVPHKRIGKWIIGSSDEEKDLEGILQNAKNSGASGLQWGDSEQLSRLRENKIKAEVGLFSAETGIIDPYLYARSLQIQAEYNGAVFVMNSGVEAITLEASGDYIIQTTRGPITSEIVINAAGLYADDIHHLLVRGEHRIYPYRGDYFSLRTRQNYEHLLYPVKKKNAPGLGIHLTVGLDGSCRLGPDVAAVESKEDFSAPKSIIEKQKKFYEAASRYLEGIRLEDLSYDFCGLRPKLRSPQDTEEKDFLIQQSQSGFISLLGIESPGLTASLDLAQRVASLL